MATDTFLCQRCGNCCRQPGPVRLTENEVSVIAGFLGLSDSDFTSSYTRLSEDRRGLVLTERPDGACIFLDDAPTACRIQPVKPAQCRGFPFTWRYANLEQICPASRTARH